MSEEIPDECLQDLTTVLWQLQPQRTLIVAPDAVSIRTCLANEEQGSDVECLEPGALTTTVGQLPMYDVVVLVGVIEQVDKQAGERLIASLRDLHARHLFILVPIGSQWSGQTSHWRQSDLLALGLSVHKTYQVQHGMLQWYRFELDSYKATPDWLNSKHWANPELFGKYRW